METKLAVDIVVIDDDLEALALRSVLEWWNIQVTLHLVGQAKDLISILDGSNLGSKIIFLMGHGNERGFLLPELSLTIEQDQPFHGSLMPAQLAEFINLPNSVVVSTACATGTPAFAETFLSAGCRAYIGPEAYPDGDASLFYILHLCYDWLCKGTSLEEAHARALAHDNETSMFRLFQKAQNS